MHELKKVLNKVDIFIKDSQIEKLQIYFELLLKWNKRTNLISKSDESHLIDRHVLESLAVLMVLKIQPGAQIIDIGSGAGFPVLPISLVRPDISFLLVESKRLKSLFLKEVINQLRLDYVHVICDRIENLAENLDWKERFDFAFSRAVASLEVVYGWVQKLIKLNGFYIAWKGGDIRPEIENLLDKFPDISVDVVKMNEVLVKPEKEKLFVQIRRKG